MFAQFVAPELRFMSVQRMTLAIFSDLAITLVSLSPVAFFLAGTIQQPDQKSLNEYPFFLGLNVFFIAAAGTVALILQGIKLVRSHALTMPRSILVLTLWLLISLFVGGQCA